MESILDKLEVKNLSHHRDASQDQVMDLMRKGMSKMGDDKESKEEASVGESSLQEGRNALQDLQQKSVEKRDDGERGESQQGMDILSLMGNKIGGITNNATHAPGTSNVSLKENNICW